MAYPTVEQVNAASSYADKYGDPYRTYLEATDEPYGILRVVWLDWGRVPSPYYEEHIKPDGSLMRWSIQP